MVTPYEYEGRRDSCTGCADVVRPGEMVAPITSDRPDRLLCVACWWMLMCDLGLPAWTRGGGHPLGNG